MRRLVIILLLSTAAFGVAPSLSNFNTGQVSPLLEGRAGFEKYTSSNRTLENMFVYIEGPAVRRPGTRFVAEQIAPPTYSELYGAYIMTYISENAVIWGFPIDFENRTTLTLDAAAPAVDIGGGIVGIPSIGHPFDVNEVIRINGTTNYDNAFTLTAGTSANELQFSSAFGAETFDGTETVIQQIGTAAGIGRMAQDSTGILYYGTTEPKVGKIAVDGTHDTDFVTPDGGWPAGAGTVEGIQVSADDAALYVYLNHTAPATDTAHIYKFDVSDGSEIWSDNDAGAFPLFDMAIDADDNVYILGTGGTGAGNANASKYDSADGAKTELTSTGKPTNTIQISGGGQYAVWVDDSLGLVFTGGWQFSSTGFNQADNLYNLASRTFDNSSGKQIALGGTYVHAAADNTFIIPTSGIVTYLDFVYIVASKVGGDDPTIFKLDSDLNVLVTKSAESGQVPQGLFVSLAGEIVIVSQAFPTGEKEDLFWFYDTDLNYLNVKIDGLYDFALRTWASFAHAAGNIAFFPGITIAANNVFTPTGTGGAELRLIPFEYSTDDSYVLSLGDRYIGFYRTVP